MAISNVNVNSIKIEYLFELQNLANFYSDLEGAEQAVNQLSRQIAISSGSAATAWRQMLNIPKGDIVAASQQLRAVFDTLSDQVPGKNTLFDAMSGISGPIDEHGTALQELSSRYTYLLQQLNQIGPNYLKQYGVATGQVSRVNQVLSGTVGIINTVKNSTGASATNFRELRDSIRNVAIVGRELKPHELMQQRIVLDQLISEYRQWSRERLSQIAKESKATMRLNRLLKGQTAILEQMGRSRSTAAKQNLAEVEQQISGVQGRQERKSRGFMGGRFGSYLLGGIAIGAVLQGLRRATRLMGDLVRGAVEFNDELKVSQSIFMGFTRSMEASRQATEMIRQYAIANKLTFQEAISAASELMPILSQAGKDLSAIPEYLDVARKLALFNQGPTGGISNAIFSIAEMESGDFRSIQRRFRIADSEIKKVAEENGLNYLEALNKILTDAGATDEAVLASMDTVNRAFSRLGDSMKYLASGVMGPLVERFLLPFLNRVIEGINLLGDFTNRFADSGVSMAEIIEMLMPMMENFAEVYRNMIELFTGISFEGNFRALMDDSLSMKERERAAIDMVTNAFTQLTEVVYGAAQMGTLFMGSLAEASAQLVSLRSVLTTFYPATLYRNFRDTGELSAINPEDRERLDILNQMSERSMNLLDQLSETHGTMEGIYGGIYEVLDAIYMTNSERRPPGTEFTPNDFSVTEEALDQFEQMEADLLKAEEDKNEQLRDLAIDHEEEVSDLTADYKEDQQELIKDYLEAEADALEELNDEVNAILNEEAGEVHDFREKLNEDRQLAEIEFQQETKDNLEEHHNELAKMQRDHYSELAEAMARFDGKRIAQLLRDQEEQKRNLQQDFADKERERRRQFQEEYDINSETNQLKLQLAREHDQETIEQLQETYAEERSERAEKHAEDLAELKKNFDEQISVLSQRLAEQRRTIISEYDQLISEITSKYTQLIGMAMLSEEQRNAIQEREQAAMTERLEAFWSSVANTFDALNNITSVKNRPENAEPTSSSSLLGASHSSFSDPMKNAINKSFALGGQIPETGTYRLHADEEVIRPSIARSLRNLFGGEINQSQLLAMAYANNLPGQTMINNNVNPVFNIEQREGESSEELAERIVSKFVRMVINE